MTQLTVKVNGTKVTPIDNFVPTFNVPVIPLHSLESDNVGHVTQPATFTFTMDVKATGPAVATLTGLALTHTAFTIEASESSNDQWTFKSLTFNDCYITSVKSTALIGTVPTVTFAGICLQVIPVASA